MHACRIPYVLLSEDPRPTQPDAAEKESLPPHTYPNEVQHIDSKSISCSTRNQDSLSQYKKDVQSPWHSNHCFDHKPSRTMLHTQRLYCHADASTQQPTLIELKENQRYAVRLKDHDDCLVLRRILALSGATSSCLFRKSRCWTVFFIVLGPFVGCCIRRMSPIHSFCCRYCLIVDVDKRSAALPSHCHGFRLA